MTCLPIDSSSQEPVDKINNEEAIHHSTHIPEVVTIVEKVMRGSVEKMCWESVLRVNVQVGELRECIERACVEGMCCTWSTKNPSFQPYPASDSPAPGCPGWI